MTDDVDIFKVDELDAFDSVQNLQGLEQPRFFRIGQVGLGEVARNDGL